MKIEIFIKLWIIQLEEDLANPVLEDFSIIPLLIQILKIIENELAYSF